MANKFREIVMSTDLKQHYKDIQADLMKRIGVKTPMAAPKITKVTVNMGMGVQASDKKELERALSEMELITGQKPIITRARRSEANFKIRQGWPIGVKVTLRGERMHRFLEYLLYVSLPAVREFSGLSKKSLDKQGNLSFGIPDQSVFRSIPFDQIQSIRGLDIAVTTTAFDAESGFVMLKLMGFPFKDKLAGDVDGNQE